MQQVAAQTSLAVSAEAAAELLGVSVRHFRGLDASGRVPAPIRMGGAVRWCVSELEAWLLAGSPNREKWQLVRGRHLGLPDA